MKQQQLSKQFKAINEFNNIKDAAELKALSSHSLLNPLTDQQLKRYKELHKKIFGGG